MIIKVLQDAEVLKTIELTTLQFKSIQLTGQKAEDYLADKLESILEFAIKQAKQTFDRITPLTEVEMESLIDAIEIESKKAK